MLILFWQCLAHKKKINKDRKSGNIKILFKIEKKFFNLNFTSARPGSANILTSKDLFYFFYYFLFLFFWSSLDFKTCFILYLRFLTLQTKEIQNSSKTKKLCRSVCREREKIA